MAKALMELKMRWVWNSKTKNFLFICLLAGLCSAIGCSANKNILYSKIGEVEDNLVGDYLSYGSVELTAEGSRNGAFVFACYEVSGASSNGSPVTLSCLYVIDIPDYRGQEYGKIIYSINQDRDVEIDVELNQDGTSVHIEDSRGVASLIGQLLLADESGPAILEIQLENYPETKLHFDLDGFADEIKPATILQEGVSSALLP